MSSLTERRKETERRQAERHARRQRRTARIVSLLVVLGVLCAAAVALRSPLFRITMVEVQGNVLVQTDEIIAVSGVGEGSNLLLVSQKAVAQRLRALPRIASVTVRRYWPDRLVLEVLERRGILLLPCGEAWLEVASDGLVIAMHLAPGAGGLPLLTGLDSASLAVGSPLPGPAGSDSVAALALVIARGEQLASAAVTAGGLTATLGDGTVLRFGQPGADLAARARTALEILGEMRSRGVAVAYIDVSVTNQPVIMPR